MDLISASVTAPAPSRAAQYVRMSTEHQQYSPENQLEMIRQYAAAHNIYSRGGLNIVGREGLNRLMDDVEAKGLHERTTTRAKSELFTGAGVGRAVRMELP